MERLSLKSYVLKCVLGSEILYILCVLGGLIPLRNIQAIELHHRLFETMPGFTWISFGSFILGAIYMLVFAIVFGSYMVWMHNSSLIKRL